MKYAIFSLAILGLPPLVFLLYSDRRWMRPLFWAMVAAMCLYIPTSINFFSNETYRGSARGMEVSIIHLLSLAMIAALSLRGKTRGLFPETGFRLYLLYFLLCLPSLFDAADRLISWYEIWKMAMLFIYYLAVYSYLKATDDIKTILGGFAVFAAVNFATIARDHLAGVYQPHGVFPHQNSMAMAMLLPSSLFYAAYLARGLRSRFHKLMALGFLCATAAVVRSYSRGALAMLPLALGIATAACLFTGRVRGWFKRILPLVLVGAAGLAVMLPRIVERFQEAPEASGNTRIELARCAVEMIRDKPLTGVGINNWGIKINPPYPYAERAGRDTNRDDDFQDGIVETVYLLVGAECGIPGLLAMLLWFAWHWISCIRLLGRLKGTRWLFIPAGLLGGFTAIYLQSCLEWVLRQQINLFCLVTMFAIVSYLNRNWRQLKKAEETAKP